MVSQKSTWPYTGNLALKEEIQPKQMYGLVLAAWLLLSQTRLDSTPAVWLFCRTPHKTNGCVIAASFESDSVWLDQTWFSVPTALGVEKVDKGCVTFPHPKIFAFSSSSLLQLRFTSTRSRYSMCTDLPKKTDYLFYKDEGSNPHWMFLKTHRSKWRHLPRIFKSSSEPIVWIRKNFNFRAPNFPYLNWPIQLFSSWGNKHAERRDLLSCGLSRSVQNTYRRFGTNYRVWRAKKKNFFLDFLTLEGETDKLSRTFGKEWSVCPE
jgi:hypothetical protein